jgi:hypothetical protein
MSHECSIAFSICLSTIWQYLELLGGTQAFLGIVVAAFRFSSCF